MAKLVTVLASAVSVGLSLYAAEKAAAPHVGMAAITKLRMDFAHQPDFRSDWSINPTRTAVFDAYRKGNVDAALSSSAEWLALCPVDAEVHLLRAAMLGKRGDIAGHFRHMHWFYGLVASIMASGDGKTPATAMKVIAVPEEYIVLRALHATSRRQALIKGPNGPMDRLVCDVGGKEVVLYFDISLSMQGIRNMRRGTPPQPKPEG